MAKQQLIQPFSTLEAKGQDTQATVKVVAANPVKKEAGDSSSGIGPFAVIVVVLALIGLFFVRKMLRQKKRQPRVTCSENDRKLLELAKSISTIYDKT